jgi:Asp-tRNA(Asn)/Glu-tRNA(Gln) amidotransferase C subunit
MSSTSNQENSGEVSGDVSLERLKIMAEIAGLNMTDEEVEEIKPLFDLHFQYATQLHAIDLGAEEIAVSFEADWPS